MSPLRGSHCGFPFYVGFHPTLIYVAPSRQVGINLGLHNTYRKFHKLHKIRKLRELRKKPILQHRLDGDFCPCAGLQDTAVVVVAGVDHVGAVHTHAQVVVLPKDGAV